MSKMMLIGLFFFILPHAIMAMDDPTVMDDSANNYGMRNRHTGKTLPSSPTSNSSSVSLNTADEDFLLGLTYLRKKKFEQSIEYFKNAARANCDAAEYNLGVIYEYGVSKEIQSDLEKAEYWYTRAHNNGEPDAKEALERVIEKKKGIWRYFPFW